MTNTTVDAVDLKKRSDIHLARKIWHMGGVATIALVYANIPERLALILLTLLWVICVPSDFLRLRSPKFNDFVIHLFKPIMRQSEVSKIAGTTYLITGVLLTAFIFPRDTVILTYLFLAFADPIASYFGIRYGKDKIFGEKSLQGTLAAFFVCALLSFGYFRIYGLMVDRIFVVSLIGGLIGATAELVPIGKLDDNLTLPLLSASALWVVFTLFGAFGIYG